MLSGYDGLTHPKRLDSLTGLRFAAALIVVFFHSVSNPQTGHALVSIPYAPMFVEVGYVGVNFFFVLSGFVLAWSDRNERYFLKFYQKRAARLYPVHLLTLVLSGLGQLVFGIKNGVVGLILSLFLLQAWFPSPDIHFAMNGVSWSLSVEAFFYLLFPFAIRELRKLNHVQAGLILVGMFSLEGSMGFISVIDPSLFNSETAWISPLFGLPQFIVGVVLGLNVQSYSWKKVPLWSTSCVVAVCYLCCCIADGFLHDRYALALPRTAAAAIMLPALCALIVSAAQQDITNQSTFWSRRSLVVLGEWSFALYMIHPLVLAVITRAFRNSLSYDLFYSILLEGLFIAASVASAGLLHVFVERPFERLLRPKKVSTPILQVSTM